MEGLFDNLQRVRDRARAALRRSPDLRPVSLVVAVKYAAEAQFLSLLRSQEPILFGENRMQDAERRIQAAGGGDSSRWHFIGHLQSNKAARAVEFFDCIHSLDSLKLALALDRAAGARGKKQGALVQVNVARSAGQHGLPPESLAEFLKAAEAFRNLDIRGLMAIAPVLEPVEATRPYFREMKRLFDLHFAGKRALENRTAPILSMGMSRDFEIAVEEGSNCIRIGSAIFAAA
ncbi:MAG: YggS family pyridoxal phosphate-dependent enzyme [Elusimicrobia bacterium]|nr:YggS family pyridoxal phosphate-dependent enzyme [Elusimicrobiota bacterium]